MSSNVLVCGGRDFADAQEVGSQLTRLHQQCLIDVIIQGGAHGADKHARAWAWANGVSVWTFCAEWEVYGKSAGPRRNQRMLEVSKPGLVLAFPGGRGTEDMVRRAFKAGVPVCRVSEDGERESPPC